MTEHPKVVFMNQNPSALEWFYRGPSKKRAEELGWDIRLNDTGGPLDPEQWAEMVADADAIMTTWGSPPVDETILAKNDKLQIIAHVGGSVAACVPDSVFERGIRVSTANPLMARTVAEHCIMLLLMGLRRAHDHIKLGTRSETMNHFKDWKVRVPQDCVIGIWGFGDIASYVVDLLGPFEPKEILVVSSHLPEEEAAERGMELVEFDDLFERADVVFTLAGMTVANTGRVGPEQLGAMKSGSIIINVGRAPLIQPDALLAELQKGRIMAVLDVFEKEPLPDEDPLNELHNVILSPHYAGTGRDAHYMAAMLDEIERLIKGEELQYEVRASRARQMTDMGAVREAQKKQ
ncbi:MAG: hydroxyacid dehydrogenase [Armatimonadota bacterium]|jgi:phosphoglycerate dehydrogenase-like enzyme